MPDAGGQPVDNAAAHAADDRADQQIAEMVRCGYLFAVIDPETGETVYGATPAGIQWLNSNGGWPGTPSAPAPVEEPGRRGPAHAAHRQRRSRHRSLLAGVTAALTLPAIAWASNLVPQVPQTSGRTTQPLSDAGSASPESNTVAPMSEGPQRPAYRPEAKAPSVPPTASPSAPSAPGRKPSGRHRGQAANEGLGDLLTTDMARTIKMGGYQVRTTIPGAGSSQSPSVQVTKPPQQEPTRPRIGGDGCVSGLLDVTDSLDGLNLDSRLRNSL